MCICTQPPDLGRCHTYSVLYTVWVTICHMCKVGYMGHSSCYCVHIGHVIPYDATSASSDSVRMAGTVIYIYIGVGPHVRVVSSGRLCREETGRLSTRVSKKKCPL